MISAEESLFSVADCYDKKIMESNPSDHVRRADSSPRRLKNWGLFSLRLRLRSEIAFSFGKGTPISPPSSSWVNPESASEVIYWAGLFVYNGQST